MPDPVHILAISGSLRPASTNSATANTLVSLGPAGVQVEVFDGMGALPHLNPDDDAHPLPPTVAHLRSRLAWADAIVICTPEYAGGVPGSLKNLLDWAVGGGELYEKPVAWINISASSGAAKDAHESLRIVLRYAGTVLVEEACVSVPVARDAVGADGLVADGETRRVISAALAALVAAVRR
jgi:chromate reductase, NAD(P)H dehydrogenase (quinone)